MNIQIEHMLCMKHPLALYCKQMETAILRHICDVLRGINIFLCDKLKRRPINI